MPSTASQKKKKVIWNLQNISILIKFLHWMILYYYFINVERGERSGEIFIK